MIGTLAMPAPYTLATLRLALTLAARHVALVLWAEVHAPRTLRAARLVGRVIRTAQALATDATLPRWLRIVLVIACLPIPGPVDNGVQLVVLAIVAVWYRPALIRAWQSTTRAN